ncbi:glutamate synthase subunit beta [Halococcoides cellulosivorans]|uniref:Glutamate synthase n=1 Tax=Halococcoides cellulosivorans TaxID=1679096 RepID=A0A2R4WZ03_9EURY|nr:glutamate synthase subunit beta [Halococcoides cellulosivorans]AWB26772.1 glutamate synthase [Halococcoides cellulosivorans]
MAERHPGGYRVHGRVPIGKRDPEERTGDYDEVWAPEWDEAHLKEQGERCMDCGTPTCMGGCPIGNIIPDWNDLVHRDDWKRALERLHATNNFPEFTGYNCPAPCENSCTLAKNDDPVTIKSIERAIVDRGWEEGWIEPEPPDARTDHEVAVVGSGPAGLSAAQQLNRAGHHVTVFERDDEIGGLMRYGIPDAKFAKGRIDRRVEQLRAEGISFEPSTEIGTDLPATDLDEQFDASCIAVGAQDPFDLDLQGRELEGVHVAMDYLTRANRAVADKPVDDPIDADGKSVVVLGGGDTGADCCATAHRQGAEQVVQIELLPRPADERPPDNPWPEQPQTYRKTYAVEEGAAQEFSVDTKAFEDTNGDGRVDQLRADRVEWETDASGDHEKLVIEPDLTIAADLVIIAVGFSGPQTGPFDALDLETSGQGTFVVDDDMMTSVDGVFAAGDAVSGPSLIVWAIGSGRDAARQIDQYLTGDSDLPASLETPNDPLVSR